MLFFKLSPLNQLFLFIFLVAIFYKILQRSKVSYVKSKVDNKTYLVQNFPDKQKAADTLAHIASRCQKLIVHLKSASPKSEVTRRLVAKYRPESVSEGPVNNGKLTTYTVNKGEEMVFCLRSRGKSLEHDDDDIHRLNMLMFVAIHEMAHIASVTVNHTPEFRKNFRFLLRHAVNAGVYQDEKFDINPKYYCGTLVSDNPLSHN